MSTFGELFEQAEQEIRAHIESAAAEFTNYFVVQGAVLLASIRLWAQLCEKTETDERAMVESPDKSSLERVVEDLAETGDPEGVMASQLLKAIVNRPESFVAEVLHCASRAFADGKGERRSTDPYDRPMSVLWSCPDPNCPPTAIAPVDVPESGEDAGAESKRFTTDEVARLLNVPFHTLHKWHQEGTGPPGYQTHKESHYRRSDVVQWLADHGVMLAVCQSECRKTYALNAFTPMEG
ncbi:MAG TPA: helix-turn-helix domain-containing protein [Propionibacteriaceae bacterium]